MGTGRPFELGNTTGKGRPPGARNKKTIYQKELEEGGVAIIHKIKERALAADPMAMRLCMERLVPLAKAPHARFWMPAVAKAADLGGALSALTEAVSEGELSAQEGEAVAKMVESQRRNFRAGNFEARIKALEVESTRGPRV
jgi:hypothetical protein